MKVVFLGGQSPANQEWIHQLADEFSGDYPKKEMVVPHFRHWRQPAHSFDVDYEVARLAKVVKENEVTVVAKSAGCLVALQSFRDYKIKMKGLVCIGFPLNWAEEQGYAVTPLLKGLKLPLRFVQKEYDSTCPWSVLQAYLQRMKLTSYRLFQYGVAGEPADDHHYADTAYLYANILPFLQELS